MKKGVKRKSVKIILRTLLCLGTLIVVLFAGVFGAFTILNLGPSKTARDLFVVSMTETSMGTVFAKIYFSDEEIAQIRKDNSIETSTDEVNTNLINRENDKTAKYIVIEDISESTFKGKMAIISDPSKVKVGVSDVFAEDAKGLKLDQLAEKYSATLAINGGYFYDPEGKSKGGLPKGIVVSDGKLLYGEPNASYEIIGFDSNNIFITGTMTAQQALDRGIRDAVSFGPSLIVNGEPLNIRGTGSGLNPRTAIGQRADGAVLMLVLEGRQPSSLGATYSDLIDIMLEYGAVNAANLDGGTSSVMVYEGEYITTCCSLYGPREIPTCFYAE